MPITATMPAPLTATAVYALPSPVPAPDEEHFDNIPVVTDPKWSPIPCHTVLPERRFRLR